MKLSSDSILCQQFVSVPTDFRVFDHGHRSYHIESRSAKIISKYHRH